VSVPRPFRAVAYAPHVDGGRQREVVGRAAAKSAAGLQRFLDAHAEAGHAVDTLEVLDLLDEIPADL